MKAQELRANLNKLLDESSELVKSAQTAGKNKRSLSGSGFYADRFHEKVTILTGIERQLRPHLEHLSLPDEVKQLENNVNTLIDPTKSQKSRTDALRSLRLVCTSALLPKVDSMTASPIPSTEMVLPLDVVRGTRGYLEKMVIQINGCYEHQWYDAASVMIRKLAECLIILVYEHKGIEAEIKGKDGNFLTLSSLIGNIKTKINGWNLSRDVGPCLDKMKELGDHSAHTRTYVATKPDIEALLRNGLRVTVEELLNHTGLK